jgi:alanyl-tRNA synthetase
LEGTFVTEVDDTVEAAPAAPQATSEVGDRIAAILDAAEASAERIRTQAREEAAEILRHAHAEAATRAEELSREPQRLRDEAAAAAETTRQTAEHHAAELRAAAAADVRSAEETVQKLQELRDAAAADVRAAADGLRAAAGRLDERILPHVDAVPKRSTWQRLTGRANGAAPAIAELPSEDLQARVKAIGAAEKA